MVCRPVLYTPVLLRTVACLAYPQPDKQLEHKQRSSPPVLLRTVDCLAYPQPDKQLEHKERSWSSQAPAALLP